MNKILKFLIVISLCLFATSLFANEVGDATHKNVENVKEDTVEPAKDSLSVATSMVEVTTAKAVKPARVFRKFKSLEQFDTPVVAKPTNRFIDKQGFSFNGPNADNNKEKLEEAKKIFEEIKRSERYIDELKSDKLNELPVAIRPSTFNNVTYTVGIAKAVFQPTYTDLTVFLKIETPRTTSTTTTILDENGNPVTTTSDPKEENNVLILGASNIKLSHDGGIFGEARLNLISQFTTNINNGTILLTLKGSFENKNKGTYAVIGCKGFEKLSIDANIKFSNGLLYPVDKDGKEKKGYVESDFKITATDWNDMVVNISLPEFGVKGTAKGTTFRLQEAVLDFSDLSNDESMPLEYLSKYYGDNQNLWRGVYIKDLEVVLPKAFEKQKSNERVAFGASDLIIDGQGVTGKFTGDNIIDLDEGSASGWAFSLDHFMLDIEVNKLKAGRFDGRMILPVSELDSLRYSALIRNDEYLLNVSTEKDIKFDVWNANVSIAKDSYVELKVKDDKFRPKASLNGSMGIASGLKKEENKPDNKDKTVNFQGIVFENMVLQTESPKFSVDYFGYRGKMELANFPVSLNEIGLRTPSDTTAELVIDFNINLTSESDGGNGGGAKLAIKAKLDEREGRDRWKYDGIDLERVFIKMEVAGMQLEGAIFIFDDDPTYGTGFAGAVGAKFTTGMKLEVEAKALFGRTPEFRYWYADASVTLPQGIPIFPGFEINAFGGGMFNRMKMAGKTDQKDAQYTQIGASSSGVIYEPFNENGFGMKASVGIITAGSPDLFNATVEFGMSFLRSGGLQEIYLKGHGKLITPLPGDFYEQINDKLSEISGDMDVKNPFTPEGSISADVFIKFDFVNDVFHATSEVYINLFGILEGVGPNGRAGWLDFYVSSDKWHILMGTPNDPIGVKLNLLILKLKTESYFMTGDDIPGSPPPPDIVADILGVDASKLDYTSDLRQLGDAKGMAFGSNWSMTTGDLKFLIFYARFDAGVGFDVMLKDYGEAHCKGSSESIGINGWYANGQAYAYLSGYVGLKFKIFGKRKKVNIFSGTGAVLMQARLPNPVWMRGYLGGEYRVLGGLIKGRFRFKIELGEKCEVVGGSVLDGIVVIGDMTPKENAAEVDVFAAPEVAFNLQINKIFELPDDTGDRKYKILLDKFEVTKNGQPIVGKIEWNNNNDLATFYSHEILPSNTKLKAYVQLHFEEYKNGNWEVMVSDGKTYLETKEVNFTTGEAPRTIPLSNIEHMYPVHQQKYFFIDEYNTGYIQLKRGQSYLFDELPGWKKNLVMTNTATNSGLVEDYQYSAAKKQVTFSLPDISTQTPYTVKVKLTPPSKEDSNLTESYTTKSLGNDKDTEGNEIQVKTKKLEGIKVVGDERELIVYDFTTSEYTTFEKKMNAISKSEDLFDHEPYPYGVILSTRIKPVEPFDKVELTGTKYSGNKPLIVARAILDDNFYKKQVYPLLYQEYPLAGKFSVTRDITKVSVPPEEAVQPMSWYLTYLENEKPVYDYNSYMPYRYNQTLYYYKDYVDLRYQLVNSDLSNELIYKYKNLVTNTFPLMRKGNYKTKLQYVLPGSIKNGGSKIRKYYNPLYE
ncbi:hypothetical protein ABW636_00690 [Aquimarina sp. 2201CG1-2-11]|uniref:hypothetical protein n=1 Tax=Aquimarina discodermiae TaxID=3231043 RepID=UPI003462D4E1